MRPSSRMTAAAFGLSVAFTLWSAASEKKGEQLFNSMCTGCHALDSEKEGPRLRGVYGRAAGAVHGFPYAEGMKTSRFVWDETTLDRWLADPESVVAGNNMAFRLENAEQRADIIAYLKTLGRK